MNLREQTEQALSSLRRDLAENGDRVMMFTPYIPLMISGVGAPPVGCIPYCGGYADAKEVTYAERVNASGKRETKTSDMIRTLTKFQITLDDISGNRPVDGQINTP